MSKYPKGSKNKWKDLFSSKDEAWRTPDYIFDHFDKKYHFNLDAAASPYNARTKKFFTKNENSLEQDWCKKGGSKKVVWLNPPYSRNLYPWIKKAFDESQKGCTVAVLVFARTDTKWFQEIVLKHAYKIYFIKGRIRFLDAKTGKPSKNSAPAPSCLVIFKNNRQKHPIIGGEKIVKPKS